MEKPLRLYWIANSGVLICAFLLYLPSIGFDFLHFDDITYIQSNPMVTSGISWEGLRWAFSSLDLNQWMPVTMLSLMFDAELFGVESASGWHLVNVLLHVLNCLLLLWALRGLLLLQWQRLFVTALFALHPMHIEVVAWVVERKELLAMTFGLLSWVAFQRWRKRREYTLYLLCCLTFLASLASKPMWVTWPLILLVIDWSTDNYQWRSFSTCLVDKLPLAAMSAVIIVVTLYKAAPWILLEGGRPELFTDPVLSAVSAYGYYLKTSFTPFDLSTFYELWPGAYTRHEVLVGGLFIMTAFALAISVRRRQPLVLVGWLWFMISLVPVSGLFQHHNQWVANRFSYFPHIGLFVSVSLLLGELVGVYPKIVRVASLLAVVLLAGFAWASSTQLEHWRDSERYWQRAIDITGGGPVTHYYFGDYFSMISRPLEALEQYETANRLASANGFVVRASIQRAALTALRLGQVELAIERTRMLLEYGFDENELLSVTVLGMDLSAVGEYPLAVGVLSKLLKNHGEVKSNWSTMARLAFIDALLDSGEIKLAEEQVDVAMTTIPNFRYEICMMLEPNSNGLAKKSSGSQQLPMVRDGHLRDTLAGYCR